MTIALFLLVLPVVAATLFFLVECLVGLPAARKVRDSSQDSAARATIVVPAHDESATIAATLSRLKEASDGQATILVVADNCDDDTAAIARQGKVDVIERNDPSRRGKGFALAFAQAHLRADPPEVVAVIDADCTIDAISIRRLVDTARATGRPVQAVNLLRPIKDAPAMVQVSNFAFMLKNLVRQRGLQRMAGSVHLTGTGMAIPWTIFDRADLATANIVEDIKLGLELTKQGLPPQLAMDATVWSDPSGAEGTLRQRERWEGGFLNLSRQIAPATIAEGFQRANPGLLVRGLDLCVPPLVLLMLLNLLALAVTAAAALVGIAHWWPAAVQLSVLGGAVAVILLVWAIHGRRFIAARTLASIPFYILWKLPMYLRLRRGRADEWLRAGR